MQAEQITRELNGNWRGGAGSAACPVCQPEGRRDQTGLSLRDGDKGPLLYCFKAGCAFIDIATAIDLPRQAGEMDFEAMREAKERRKEYDAAKLKKVRSVWDRALPIQDTKAQAYLRSRGITIPLPDSLRFSPDQYHKPSGRYHCAMIGNVFPTGGVHRTYIEKGGGKNVGVKISGDNAKMMYGPCSGGAVRLSNDVGPLVIAEGIETALSVLQLHAKEKPTVWAALSTSGMVGLKLPPATSDLVIAPDGEIGPDGKAAGRAAAASLAERATGLGWNVSILDPGDGLDWNDVLQSGVAA